MAVFIPETDDLDLVQEFCADYGELYQSAEAMIIRLENSPSDTELLNDLFRSVHTVKGNSGLLMIWPLVDLLQELESILDQVRSHDIVFEPLIGDLTLLLLDRCKVFLAELNNKGQVEYDAALYSAVSNSIAQAVTAAPVQRAEYFRKALSLLDPNTAQIYPDTSSADIFVELGITETDDLRFILDMSEHAQSRAKFWNGRLSRVLHWVIALNRKMGKPVEAEQLFVAVCLHDIGMAMLPSKVINKEEPLTQQELHAVQDHVWVASRLASSFPNWHAAKRIIDHHQEHFDGSGYPLGLSGNDICKGAQMLAVVHAFEAITHGYSKTQSRKRPLMRAVMELNRFAGVQFNPELVSAFMDVTRD